ncbi:TIM barrel protein [Paraburkholderia sp. BR10882]|uniref:TIM barrel protein n=2 Tax=unclassified Paraburkholderia TaxID=2615204 RepID=UPI0034CEC1C2
MAEVAIVASAFGAQAIWRDGHAAWSRLARRAGAHAFEVRRELMHDADAQPEALRALGKALADEGLWRVWSTPDALYGENGALDEAALGAAVAAGRALGARFVKLQLGGFSGDASAARLASLLEALGARTGDIVDARNGPRVVVENGQLEQGGKLDQFIGLFNALRDGGAPDVIGMTFDIGNWQWPGEPPLLAAAALAPHVEYIHCKAVVGEGARRFAAAPGDDDALCRAALALLPTHVPRGIEFPFDPARIHADAAHYVEWLAAA